MDTKHEHVTVTAAAKIAGCSRQNIHRRAQKAGILGKTSDGATQVPVAFALEVRRQREALDKLRASAAGRLAAMREVPAKTEENGNGAPALDTPHGSR